MKKIFFLLVSIIALLSAKAQIQFGIKAGVNIAYLNIPDKMEEITYKSSTNFNAGIQTLIHLRGHLYLQPEIVYSGQGDKQTFTIPDLRPNYRDTITNTYNYSYINVPILIKYQHISGLSVETGPQIGFLVAAKLKDPGQTINFKSGTSSADFSWSFGVGYKIPVVNLGIDVRDNIGLTNTNKGFFNAGPIYNPTVKNRVLQFGLSYQFGFRRLYH